MHGSILAVISPPRLLPPPPPPGNPRDKVGPFGLGMGNFSTGLVLGVQCKGGASLNTYSCEVLYMG